VALYAPDASIEIPVGSGPPQDTAIRAFTARTSWPSASRSAGRSAPRRGRRSDAGAIRRDGRLFEIDVIDVVRFDPQGRLTSLRAFFDLSGGRPL
jgi:ketosteroid isomerase-like protein